MIRAGGGGTSTQRDLLGSPGWQEKLKHYLLNHVRVKTNICLPSVQPSDPLEPHPPHRDVSIIPSHPSLCFLPLPSPRARPGRGGEGRVPSGGRTAPCSLLQTLLLNPCTWRWELLLLYESVRFRADPRQVSQTLAPLPGAPVLIVTNTVNLGESFPSPGSQFPY